MSNFYCRQEYQLVVNLKKQIAGANKCKKQCKRCKNLELAKHSREILDGNKNQ